MTAVGTGSIIYNVTPDEITLLSANNVVNVVCIIFVGKTARLQAIIEISDMRGLYNKPNMSKP